MSIKTEYFPLKLKDVQSSTQCIKILAHLSKEAGNRLHLKKVPEAAF